LSAKFGDPFYGILLTQSQERAQSAALGYYRELLDRNVEFVSALVLPPERGPGRGEAWVRNFSVGLAGLLARMSVRRGVGIGAWYYVEDARRYMLPVELLYWALLFAGLDPLFMRCVIYSSGRFIECPSHLSPKSVVERKGKDYRGILLMSLTAIYLGMACSPYRIAVTIEEVSGNRKFGSADSLRKTISGILSAARACSLVDYGGPPPVYTLTPFGKLLLDALLSDHLRPYLKPSEAAMVVDHILAQARGPE